MKQKIYKVADIDTYMKDLHLVKDLSETKKLIQEQEEEFIKLTKKHRATFYRYRKKLGLKSKTTKFSYKLKDIGICYFCLRKAENIHHINKNRKDNSKENLLPLCRSCHTKVHRILKVAINEDLKSH